MYRWGDIFLFPGLLKRLHPYVATSSDSASSGCTAVIMFFKPQGCSTFCIHVHTWLKRPRGIEPSPQLRHVDKLSGSSSTPLWTQHLPPRVNVQIIRRSRPFLDPNSSSTCCFMYTSSGCTAAVIFLRGCSAGIFLRGSTGVLRAHCCLPYPLQWSFV
jgi:hypothetical protein